MPKDERRAKNRHAEPTGTKLGGSFDVIFPMAYAILFALIALWVKMKFFPIGDIGVESDFYGGLVPAAQELWKGNLSVASYPYKGPFYSFALVFVHLFGGEWYTNGIVLNLLCAAGSIVVLYRLLLRIFSRWLAVTATISVSLVAEFFLHAHKASSDMLFFLLCFLAISLLLIEKWSPLLFAGAGALSAFAFLTRYNGAFLPVMAVIMILFIDPWSWPRRRRIIAAAIYLSVFILVCAPWFALNWAETGSALETSNLRNIVEEFYGGVKERAIPRGGFPSIGSMILHDPVHFTTHYLLNIPRHFWYDMLRMFRLGTGTVVMLGLLRLLLIPPTRKEWAFFSFGIGYFLSMCMVFHLPRFSLPLAPMYAAAGFSLLVGPHAERRSRLGEALGDHVFRGLKRLAGRDRNGVRIAIPLVIASLLLMQILWVAGEERFYFEKRPLFILRAAGFLKEHARRADRVDQQVVTARKPHIAYYSGLKYQQYPIGWTESWEFVTFAVEQNIDYIAYSPLEERRNFNNEKWLADMENTDGIERIFSDRLITVFEVADWLDLDEKDGQSGLANRLSRLRSLEQSNEPAKLMRACAEIHLIYSYNGKPGQAAEYLIRSLEAARRLPDQMEAERSIRSMRLDFIKLSNVYFRLRRRDEGYDLWEYALLEFEDYWTEQELVYMHSELSKYYSGLGQRENALRHVRAVQDLTAPPRNQR